jgi:predicted transposase YdaD
VASHDESYKLLFSHPEMVEDLLRGFVAEDWVGQLDFSTLEKVGGQYVSDDLRERESDIIWRVRWGGEEWLYIYVLLEFQSAVDPYMGVRVMTYVGLLYQDIIRQKLVLPLGKLPPVFAAILYNGLGRWGAADDVADLIATVPGGLDRYRPHLRYCLLDAGRLAESPLESSRNLVAALFQLERSREPADFERVLVFLGEWLKEPEHAELQRAFAVWVSHVLLPARMPGVDVPNLANLQEVKSMLTEIDWTREWRQKGYEEGREQGLEQGREQGLEQGREQGLEKARREDLEALRRALLRRLTLRFGPVPDSVRERLDTMSSMEELADLLAESAVAPSLAALGLT